MSQNSYHHEFCAQLSQIVSLAEWPFYGLLELYEQKYHKTHISVSFVHKYDRSCFKLIWPFYGLLELYEQKRHKTHISARSVHKYQTSFF